LPSSAGLTCSKTSTVMDHSRCRPSLSTRATRINTYQLVQVLAIKLHQVTPNTWLVKNRPLFCVFVRAVDYYVSGMRKLLQIAMYSWVRYYLPAYCENASGAHQSSCISQRGNPVWSANCHCHLLRRQCFNLFLQFHVFGKQLSNDILELG